MGPHITMGPSPELVVEWSVLDHPHRSVFSGHTAPLAAGYLLKRPFRGAIPRRRSIPLDTTTFHARKLYHL